MEPTPSDWGSNGSVSNVEQEYSISSSAIQFSLLSMDGELKPTAPHRRR